MNTSGIGASPLAAALLLAIASQAVGQTDLERESLAGLDGLFVVVEALDEVDQAGGLTREALQTYLELRLRQAAIPVPPMDESPATERSPYLYLAVTTLQLETGRWTYMLELVVRQAACIKGGIEGQGLLAQNKGCMLMASWDRSGLFLSGPQPLVESVLRNLAELMDMFVNDYLAVNR